MKKILFLFLFFISKTGFSCECSSLQPISKDLCKPYDVIFYGKVDSISSNKVGGTGTAYFAVKNLFKGAVEEHIAVDYDRASDCLMSFEKNEEWIIYGIYQRFDLVTVDICSHSRKKANPGTADMYQAQSGKSFEEENEFLKTELGVHSFAIHNNLNDQETAMGPRNEQPSAMNKLWLLLVSLGAMIVVFIVSKKYKKNDK